MLQSLERESTMDSNPSSARTNVVNAEESTEDENFWDEKDSDTHGLLAKRNQRRRRRRRIYEEEESHDDWVRPYWLGMGLFLLLLCFWVLDSLKDNVLGRLTNGNLEEHQPPAKLFSVFATLALVLLLEHMSNERNNKSAKDEEQRSDEDILSGGGKWQTIEFQQNGETEKHEEGVTPTVFNQIGVPYCLVFGIMAYVLQFNQSVATSSRNDPSSRNWTFVGYIFYAAIESFGSISVATFWSYANSTLSLAQAESYYGTIIAIAQLGAILGSTLVTTHIWNTMTLIILACLVILLHIVVMWSYSARFPATLSSDDRALRKETTTDESMISGVHLILRHNYVLLIMGASCLYEISLTCLNYQMTLLGWSKFEGSEEVTKMTFAQFMGHYGQMVNLSSLLFSSVFFPFLIRRVGLRLILRGFPTLLLLVNVMAFGILPGNLPMLFFSLSFLKAMTYSIHDPAKEILYLPTSNAIKFKAKFWIDVVGARIAKALGSSINNYAGSVDRSIRISSTPSLVTAFALWYVCYKVGIFFEDLVATNTVVGVNDGAESENRQLLYETPEDDGYINDAGLNETDDDTSLFDDPEGRIR